MKEYLNIILPLLAAGCVIGGGITLYFTYPLMAMKPAQTGPVPGTDHPPVYALRSNRGAMYFVDTGAGWLLIDTGSNAKKIEASLPALGVAPADVKWVLLTHSDYDHVGGLPLFTDAGISMGADELELIRSGKKKLPGCTDLNAVHPLRDGEALACGDVAVKCVAAPGHTAGSMAYLVDGSFLFTGDALRHSAKGDSVHPYTKDKARAKKTIAALPADARMVLTSHYGYYPAPTMR